MPDREKPASSMRKPEDMSEAHIGDFLEDNKGEENELQELNEKYQAVFLRSLEVLKRLREKGETDRFKRFMDYSIQDLQMAINRFLMHKLPVYSKNNKVDKIQKFEDALGKIEEWLDKLDAQDN